jgi:tetratricopeptide (TPR) repeat protein
MASHTETIHRARQLHHDGQLQTALELCEEILRVDAHDFDALYLAGLISAQMRQPELAIVRFDQALGVKPDNAAAYCNKAVALQALGATDAALASYETAIRIKPDYALALTNRGNVLVELRRWDEALGDYGQALLSRPDYVAAHFNRANALQALQKHGVAIQGYDAALALSPGYAEAHCNRGAALAALNRLPEALASFDAAIALRPEFAEAHFGKAITLLLSGEWQAGWSEYEWRPQSMRKFEKPRWRGAESIVGKRLLIHCELGLGDTLQYCRYAKLVSDLQATVILQVQGPLVGVLKNLTGAAQVIGPEDPLPEYDYHCPLLSLPFAFKTNLNSIPATPRYLQADPERVVVWRNRLAATPGIRIGLVWRGDPDNKDDLKRSMPLTNVLALLPPQLRYVSLQKSIAESESVTLERHPNVSILSDELNFPDAAAVCECLDLVISVDTSVAHLSAALGKRTWILLPFNPDCRWLLDRSDSPWYPSVTLYRQPTLQDWHSVLTRIAGDLRQEFIEPKQGSLGVP